MSDIANCNALIKTKKGNYKASEAIKLISGTYAHPDLVPTIASWVNHDFAVILNKMFNDKINWQFNEGDIDKKNTVSDVPKEKGDGSDEQKEEKPKKKRHRQLVNLNSLNFMKTDTMWWNALKSLSSKL